MRRQLAVYSPLPAAALASATVTGLTGVRDGSARALADRLRDRFGAHAAVLTGSGTQALQLALGCLDSLDGGGAIVAMPAYSCFDLVSAAVGAGIRVRFYDVDPVSLGPDLESLRSALAEGVSGVVAGNLHGYPLDWPEIRSLCADAGVPVVEDAAQGVATGPTASGGSLGDATVLSFGRGKGWTGGGGGALLLRGSSKPWHDRSRIGAPGTGRGVKSALVTAAAWALGRPSLYGIPSSIPALGLGETRYKDPVPPTHIAPFSAALATRTEAPATAAIDERRRVAARWLAELDTHDPTSVAAVRPLGGSSACTFLRLALLAEDAATAGRLAETSGRYGVARGYPVPLHRLPQAQPIRAGDPVRLPGAERLAETLITLPTHRRVSGSDIGAVLARMRSARP